MTYFLCISSNINELKKISIWLEKYLPNTVENTQKNNILLLTQEIVTNAIMHGNQNDTTKKITITLTTDSKELILSIQDEGKGIHSLPSKEEAKKMDYLDENGRGLKLAVLLSDTIQIDGNIITLHFKL